MGNNKKRAESTLLFAQQVQNKSRLLFEQARLAFDENNDSIWRNQMDKNHKFAAKVVVNTVTGNYIKS